MVRLVKISSILAVVILLIGAVSQAQAESKNWPIGWNSWFSGMYKYYHSRNSDFVPYVNTGKEVHLANLKDDNWSPDVWAHQYDDPKKVVENFYESGIITRQYSDDDVAILQVGPGFYHLSAIDQNRVAKYLEFIHGQKGVDMFFKLQDWHTKEIIGVYNSKYGLQFN